MADVVVPAAVSVTSVIMSGVVVRDVIVASNDNNNIIDVMHC